MDLPAKLKERVDEVIGYVGDTTSNWLLVKRQLINILPNSLRSLFSVRHPCTKKHFLNEFDSAVISYWQEQTGILLELSEKDLHQPDWEHKPKGWALILVNKERKRQRSIHDPEATFSPTIPALYRSGVH